MFPIASAFQKKTLTAVILVRPRTPIPRLRCLRRGSTYANVNVLSAMEGGKKLKVVFVGAHVDNWVVAAGTLARYTRLGQRAVCYSFFPGRRGHERLFF